MIKLKANIQVAENEEKLLIYDSEINQILVEIKKDKKQKFNLEEFKLSAYFYQKIEKIFLDKYGQIILSLYKKKPEFFDVIKYEEQELASIQNDIELTVDKNLFFLTYEYDVKKYLEKKHVVFWGESEITKLLADSLQTIVASLTIYRIKKDFEFIYYENVELKNWKVDYLGSVNEQVLHIVFENSFSEEDIKVLNKQLGNKVKVLYYKAGVNELLIGPLIIGKETCSYEDYQAQLPSYCGRLSKTAAYIGAGLINRIIYFLILDTLAYIGEDAQLPINSVFKMNTYSLALETYKIYKGVDCNESRS